MTEQNDKKTLTLTSNKLGLKLGDKLGIKQGAVKSTSPSSKGRVVVVTKQARSASRPASALKNAGGLTSEEQDKRILALKSSEIAKKEQAKKISQRVELDTKATVIVQEEVKQEEIKEEKEPEVVVAESTVQVIKPSAPAPEVAKPAIKRINLDDLLRKNKVKNLDEIYRPVRQPEEEKIPEVVVPTKPHKAPSLKTATDALVRKPSSDFEDDAKAAAVARKEEDRKGPKKISVAQVMMMDSEEGVAGRRRSLASIRRAREKAKRKMMGDSRPTEKIIREVMIPDFIVVQELANRMAEKTSDVIKALMKLGMIVTMNQSIDADTAELVISEFGHKIKRVTETELEAALMQKVEDLEGDELPRAPVVTIMGHVDHGKTSLLDALRNTDVAAGEAGGITQHIGAYQVHLENGAMITFLDTPGHEAFTAMRMRGAKVTDIVVLVVAADDGIMQQTIEAISHAKAAQVPIIVAINKIDKPEANPDRVKQELLQHGIVPEEMGGDAIVVEVSAKQKINLDKLEELILLQAEMLSFKANPNRLAEGAVIEAKVDKGRGPIATLLVQKGTIKVGDIVVAGTSWGKIRALINDKAKNIQSAGPSTPIEILGLEQAPVAGDEFTVVPNEKTARDLAALRMQREKQKKHAASKPASLDIMFKRANENGIKELPVIIKGDVQGSVEAIVNSLQKLGTEEVSVKVLHNAVGGITESDVTLATASNAIIMGFNVRANQQAREMARTNGVDLRYYSIIYNLVDDIKAAMGGMLSPIVKETIIGYVEIRDVFNLTKFGKVAGCYVTEGHVRRAASARIIRDNVVVYDGKLKALKRFKEDIKEVGVGFECGLSFENYEDIKVGDKIEIYETTEQVRTL
ncbi:MAG: translation initiation factor IF-2 [Candidatus Jidaibacter sp.]|nr:translation initiation factor IF-2 [Candidatus Jidaibacter sp.]